MRIESTETTMGAAMRRAGVDDAPARLMTLAVKCLRLGKGDIAHACREMHLRASSDADLVRAALSIVVRSVADDMAGKDLRGGGQRAAADNGQTGHAAAAQTVERPTGHGNHAGNAGQGLSAGWRSPLAEDDGQMGAANNGRSCFASSSATQREAAGHVRPAEMVGHQPSAESPLARTPNPPRGADVVGRIQPLVGKTIFDKIKLADGTPWSAVCYRELFGLARDGGIAAAILKDIPAPRDDGAKVSELVSEARFAQIVAASGGRGS